MGICVYRDTKKRLSGLFEALYIDKVLKSFSIEASKRGLLPFKNDFHLLKSICPKINDKRRSMEAIPYALAIGSLMYVMLCIRTDITYTVSVTN